MRYAYINAGDGAAYLSAGDGSAMQQENQGHLSTLAQNALTTPFFNISAPLPDFSRFFAAKDKFKGGLVFKSSSFC